MGFRIKGIDNCCSRLNDCLWLNNCRALVNVSDIECSMDVCHGGV